MEPVKYVSPTGTGDGSIANPTEFTAALAWANHELEDKSARIVLLPGLYTAKLQMDRIGNAAHTLIIETASDAAILLALSNQSDVNAGTLTLSGCQNIILRRLHFRQVPEPRRARTGHFGIANSKNILVEDCTWKDLEVAFGAASVSRASSRIVFSRCEFNRLWGEGPAHYGNHMVYIAKVEGNTPPTGIHLINCLFVDQYGGSYVKMDQGVRDSSVIGCTFVASGLRSHGYGTQGGDGTIATKFIQIGLDPRIDDIKCENITVVENRFVNASTADIWSIWCPRPRIQDPTGRFEPNVMIGSGELRHG